MMKTITSGLLFAAVVAISSPALAGGISFSDRVELGLDLGKFFEPASGFSPGDPSHTNTLSTTVSGVKMDVTLTVKGFNESGAPAGLRPRLNAVGIDGEGTSVAESDRINVGERLEVTFDSIAFSLDPPTPGLIPDPASFASLSSVQLSAFEGGTDAFTYAGIGAGTATGDDTSTIEFDPNVIVADGNSFSITGDSGSFRVQFISLGGMSDIVIDPNFVPEPSTAMLSLAMLGSIAGLRRRK